MELQELEEALTELRPDDVTDGWGLRLCMSMLGQVAEGLMHIDSIDENMDKAVDKSGHTADAIREMQKGAKEEMIGALFIAVAELAADHDISIEDAVALRVEQMMEAHEARESVKKWKEAGLLDESGNVDTELDASEDKAFF